MISALNLIIGLLIYIFLRQDTYIHQFLNEEIQVYLYKIAFNADKYRFVSFLKYYIVDYLWGAALTFSLCSVAANPNIKSAIAVSCVSFVLGTEFEIAQYFSVINGTFDWLDICMYATASFLCAVININILAV